MRTVLDNGIQVAANSLGMPGRIGAIMWFAAHSSVMPKRCGVEP
jgi:hypothetical protein